MARKVNAETRRDLLKVIRERYQAGTKDEKLRILDEFVAVTGYHRKHAIRLFNADSIASGSVRRSRLPLYDEAVREALVVLWEASDRVCGKRLKPLLPILVSALERHGHLTLAPTVRARVLAASAATLDRLLASTRAAVSGRRERRRAMPAVQQNVPVRTSADWETPLPGDMEADLVSHGGESAAGNFVHTLTLTDVASGWTECVALVVRGGALVVAALEQMRTRMAFPLRGFDTDNGGEFMNETVAAYCLEHRIPRTRSRPYHKNDQAWVEQKNGSVVRRLGRLPTAGGPGGRRGALAALRGLPALRELLPALLQVGVKDAPGRQGSQDLPRARDALREAPGFRCRDRRDEGAPASGGAAELDPLRLLEEIRAIQHHLAALASGQASHLPGRVNADADCPLNADPVCPPIADHFVL